MAQKKSGRFSGDKRAFVDRSLPSPSIRRQCELLGLNRSTLYYRAAPENEENRRLMSAIDRVYTEHPYFGSRKIAALLRKQTEWRYVDRKRIARLMRVMGIEAIYPKPRTSQSDASHPKFPYLLKGLEIDAPNRVWCSDITYSDGEGFCVFVRNHGLVQPLRAVLGSIQQP